MLVDEIIEKYYLKDSVAFRYLNTHSKAVTELAVKIAEENQQLNPDMDFINEAAMLHDIGIYKTNAPIIGCNGTYPYIAHGYLGRQLLEKEGFPKHALVCERHIGVGITLEEILKNKLPLPKREMVPVTTEEKIICLADKFYSKSLEYLESPKSIQYVRNSLAKFGDEKVDAFDELLKLFDFKDI